MRKNGANLPTMGTLAVSVASLQTKVDSIDDKLTLFIKTATSPEVGFVSSGFLSLAKAEGEREHININKRIDEINAYHNKRITDLEKLSTRVLLAVVGVMGGVVTDIVLHLSGVKP